MFAKAHYGNPLIEQRELDAGRAKVLLSSSVIEVSGEDRLDWLHSMLTADFKNLQLGESREALWLDAQGRVDFDFHAVALAESVLLIVASDAVSALMVDFDKLIFRSKVQLARRDDLVVFGVHADVDQAVVAKWIDPWPNVVPGGVRYAQGEPPKWFYREYIVEAVAQNSFAPELTLAGTDAQLALRIVAHRPYIDDADTLALPHEHDWLTTAVHMSKGCYRGQEAVAKTHNLGHPPRRVTLLHIDGSGHMLPEAGSPVQLDGQTVGRVNAIAQHYEAGPVALASIRRSVPIDAVLEVFDLENNIRASATQEMIVPPTAGAANAQVRKNFLMGGGH